MLIIENFSESYLQTVRLCWLSVKRASIQHLYDENNMKAWFDAFERFEDGFDKLCITEAWMRTRFIHLN